MRSFGAREWDIARLVWCRMRCPTSLPGLRLAIGRAVLGVVVAEFFGSQEGFGVMMVRAGEQLPGRYRVRRPDRVRGAVAGDDVRGQDDREAPERLAPAARQRWRGKVKREQARPALFSVRATGRVRLAECYPPLRSGRGRLAKCCVVHVQTLFLLWFCRCLRLRKLASFAENVNKWLRTELTRAAVDGAASLCPSAALNGTDCGTCPRSLCKYNRWKSKSALPCKQQEIYREIFSRKLNRQNLARTRASRPSFHLAAKALGGGPPHDIPSSQRAKNNARRGNPHRN